MPENVDYGWRPYTVGQWAWVEPYGWTWVSEEPWGWATYHYGRWTYAEDYGWVWVPGTTWAPAWVAFRYGDPWVGWAPLPPGPSWRFNAALDIAGLNLDVSIGSHAWSFVPLRYFAEPDLRSRYVVATHNRREAALKALDDEKKRLEALLDRQRKRREREVEQGEPAPSPPPKADDSSSKKEKGRGKRDKDSKDGAK